MILTTIKIIANYHLEVDLCKLKKNVFHGFPLPRFTIQISNTVNNKSCLFSQAVFFPQWNVEKRHYRATIAMFIVTASGIKLGQQVFTHWQTMNDCEIQPWNQPGLARYINLGKYRQNNG